MSITENLQKLLEQEDIHQDAEISPDDIGKEAMLPDGDVKTIKLNVNVGGGESESFFYLGQAAEFLEDQGFKGQSLQWDETGFTSGSKRVELKYSNGANLTPEDQEDLEDLLQ